MTTSSSHLLFRSAALLLLSLATVACGHPRLIVQGPLPPEAHVTVVARPLYRQPAIVVRAPTPEPRVIVQAPQPPRVIVASPDPLPPARVVVHVPSPRPVVVLPRRRRGHDANRGNRSRGRRGPD